MLSQQLEPNKKIQTSCKECLFAVYGDKTQIGCQFDKLNKFDNNNIIEAYDDEKEFYVIDRLCNHYRDNKWNNGIADKNKVEKETQVSFDILFNCEEIDDNYSQYITNFYEYYNSDVYDPNRLSYTLYHSQQTKTNRSTVATLYRLINKAMLSVNSMPEFLFLHEKFMKTTRSYHVKINKENDVDINLILKINNLVNTDMKKAIVINNKNISIISNLAYKVTAHKLESINYNQIIDAIINESKTKNLYFEV